jgi:hypothetical protein
MCELAAAHLDGIEEAQRWLKEGGPKPTNPFGTMMDKATSDSERDHLFGALIAWEEGFAGEL